MLPINTLNKSWSAAFLILLELITVLTLQDNKKKFYLDLVEHKKENDYIYKNFGNIYLQICIHLPIFVLLFLIPDHMTKFYNKYITKNFITIV